MIVSYLSSYFSILSLLSNNRSVPLSYMQSLLFSQTHVFSIPRGLSGLHALWLTAMASYDYITTFTKGPESVIASGFRLDNSVRKLKMGSLSSRISALAESHNFDHKMYSTNSIILISVSRHFVDIFHAQATCSREWILIPSNFLDRHKYRDDI